MSYYVIAISFFLSGGLVGISVTLWHAEKVLNVWVARALSEEAGWKNCQSKLDNQLSPKPQPRRGWEPEYDHDWDDEPGASFHEERGDV